MNGAGKIDVALAGRAVTKAWPTFTSNGKPPRLNEEFPVFSFGNGNRRYIRYYLTFSKTRPD